MLSPNPLRLMVEKTSLQGESKQVGSRERGIPNVPNVPNVIQMVCRPDAVDTGNVKICCVSYAHCLSTHQADCADPADQHVRAPLY